MSVLEKIRQQYLEMSVIEKKIADCILADPAAAMNATVVYMSAKAGVSQGSVMNFATALGFSGFSQFKIELAKSVGFQSRDVQPNPEDLPKQVFSKLMEAAKNSFESTYHALGDELDTAAVLLRNANSILVTGMAQSATIAQDLAGRMLRIGLPAQVLTDPLMASVAGAQLTEKGVLVAVSHSGRTRDTLACAKVASQAGARVIGLTSYDGSPLAKLCQVSLVAVSNEAKRFYEAVSARLTLLLLGDSLIEYIALQADQQSTVYLDRMVEIYEMHRETLGEFPPMDA